MANPYYTVTGDFNPDRESQSNLSPSSADIQAQLQRVQQKLDAGQYVAPSEVPAPWLVKDGQLVKDTKGSLLDQILTYGAGGLLASTAAVPAIAALTGAGGAATGGAAASAGGGGGAAAIPTTIGLDSGALSALGGGSAVPALAGGGAAAGATGAGLSTFGPLAGGYGGATTAATVPAALAPSAVGAATPGILGTATDVGRVLSGFASQDAYGRYLDNNQQLNAANTGANIYRTALDGALKGPSDEARATALGDTLAHVQPFQWTGSTHKVGNIPVPDFTGGLGPQNFGPNTRAAGQKLSDLSLSRIDNPAFALPTPPTMPSLSGPGAGARAAGYLGAATQVAGAMSPYLKSLGWL